MHHSLLQVSFENYDMCNLIADPFFTSDPFLTLISAALATRSRKRVPDAYASPNK